MSNPLIEKYSNEKRWVNYKIVTRQGKITKIPYNSFDGRHASSVNPEDWETYKKVKEKSDQVGIVFTPEKTLLGIDIDHCLTGNEITHEQKEQIASLIIEADTYTEISPSGTGLHLYLALSSSLSLTSNRKAPYEAYTSGRYFTVTQNVYKEAKDVRVVTPQEALDLLSIIGYPWNKNSEYKDESTDLSLTDEEVLEKMFASKIGDKIRSLYSGNPFKQSTSEDDMAFVSHLAFWTRKDPVAMERIWLASPLGARKKTQERSDYRRRTINVAISNCKNTYTPNKSKIQNNQDEEKKKMSQSDILLEIIDSKENIVLFHDEKKENYISLEVDDHNEIWSCKSKFVKTWLAHEYFKQTKSAVNSETITNVTNVLAGRAAFEGETCKLNNRSAWLNGDLWYDLTNKRWQAIKITESGWDIVDNPPILFKRFKHSIPQVIPEKSNGDVSLLLNYVNIVNPQHKLLLLVYLISCFIPDYAHAMLVIYGSQGSAKSTLSKLLRHLIDPSNVEVASLPDNLKELVQSLDHHAFLFFDNVSYISETTSDILAKAITGSGFLKRELYSDDEDIVYTFKKCIGMNGINLMGTRPDLLERSLILELNRIEPENRKQEKEIWDNFEKDRPLILGGILDVLVKALKIKPTIKVSSLPRMADFTVWGCAIAEAMGYKKEDFLNAYQVNINQQTDTALNENIVASTLISFMESRDEWKGTPTELLQQLNNTAFDYLDRHEKYWPKASNSLMRKLNELRVNLKAVGIVYTTTEGKTREVHIKKIITDDTDGNDDVSETLTETVIDS